ncbi:MULTISPECIES: hypothetical protein [Rhodococcus]|uniref:Uncharacterized protein n=1 Tax=Rhodococcus qingshengii JCM 15477 TaxID=1303681 RepID=A0AB38RNI6_RHOSG|nr:MULTISPECIES: hypothetical protein [Rhodococcus]MDA3637501.1 hypothetical protein [Rhodococcus sp. C-2]UPU46685.1 hypothetical protein M0639_31220 [Rhodococcus qingshengii JCM 15477]
MSADRLLCELEDGRRPLSEIVFGLSSGELTSPASTGLAADRWLWLADLLTHPTWGMAAIVDGIDDVCVPVARLCQLTANAIHPLNLRELWSAEQLPAKEQIADHTPGTTGHWEALSAAIDLITDGLDHCEGLDVSGSEAAASAFTAIINAQDANTARSTITAAVEHWAQPPTITVQTEYLGVAS